MIKNQTVAVFCLAIFHVALIPVSVSQAAAQETGPGARYSSSGGSGLADTIAERFGSGIRAHFDDHGRLVIKGSPNAPIIKAQPDLRKGIPTVVKPDMKAAAATILDAVHGDMWNDSGIAILQTKVEHSRFGSNSVSTLKLNGHPVTGPLLRVRASASGNITRVKVSLPASTDRPLVSRQPATVSLETALETVRTHSLEYHNGLICPDKAQRVWFMTSSGILVPAGRVLLRSVDMSSLKEAIVDLRTGELVRFAELARR